MRKWFTRFKTGDFNLENQEGSARPSATDEDLIKIVVESTLICQLAEIVTKRNQQSMTILWSLVTYTEASLHYDYPPFVTIDLPSPSLWQGYYGAHNAFMEHIRTHKPHATIPNGYARCRSGSLIHDIHDNLHGVVRGTFQSLVLAAKFTWH